MVDGRSSGKYWHYKYILHWLIVNPYTVLLWNSKCMSRSLQWHTIKHLPTLFWTVSAWCSICELALLASSPTIVHVAKFPMSLWFAQVRAWRTTIGIVGGLKGLRAWRTAIGIMGGLKGGGNWKEEIGLHEENQLGDLGLKVLKNIFSLFF